MGLAKAYCSVEKFSQCLSTLEQAIELVNLFENGEGDTNPNLNSYYEEALTSFRRSLNVYKDLQNFSKLVSFKVVKSHTILCKILLEHQFFLKQFNVVENLFSVINVIPL